MALPALAQNNLPSVAPAEAEKAAQGISADEIARELANPNNSLASLTFKNQFRNYAGDFPDSSSQNNYTLVFQPVFPFPMKPTESGGKANFFVRPGFPLLVDQPIPTVANGKTSFGNVTALGDIGFDVGYGVTEKSGFLWAFGMVGTLPTATNPQVAGKELRLGPEALFAKFEKWGLYGVFPSHQWSVVGWSNKSSSVSQLQLFLNFLPGGGWSVGSTPILNYDWNSRESTIPLNLSISKTVSIGNTPVKLGFEANYYIQRPDLFGPKVMIGLSITPVVNNFLLDAFK